MTVTRPIVTRTVAEFMAAKHQLLASRARNAPDAPDAPEASRTSEAPEVSRAREASESWEAPEVSRARGTSDVVEHQLTLGLVPTMGALHAGHAELMRQAVAECDVVAATIFVNPLQFGDPADLARYPKTWDADVALLAEAGVDIVFAPSVEEVYPNGLPTLTVAAGPLAEVLEGASRPGHFAGVLTVVAKLLHLGAPPFGGLEPQVGYKAFFGQKDAQQLALIRLMVRELNFAVQIVPVETVREPDGLAMSSRNRFLSPADRARALSLSATLREAVRRVEAGEALDIEGLRASLRAVPGVELDYLELVDAITLEPVSAGDGSGNGTGTSQSGDAGSSTNGPNLADTGSADAGAATSGSGTSGTGTSESGERLLLVAAKVGSVRLIDNVLL